MTITRKPHAWPHPRFKDWWECGHHDEPNTKHAMGRTWQEALANWLHSRMHVELLSPQVRDLFKERK